MGEPARKTSASLPRWLGIFGLFALAGSLAGYAIRGREARVPIQTPSQDVGLKRDLKTLAGQVQALSTANARLQARLTAVEQTRSVARHEQPPQSVEENDVGSDEERVQQRNAELADKFEQMSSTADSRSREAAFLAAAGASQFREFPLLSVECRERLCRAEYNTAASNVQSFMRVTTHELFDGQVYAHMVGRDRVVAYVASPGATLP